MLKYSSDVDWITAILVACFIIAAVTKILYPFRFQEFLKLPLTNKYFFVFGKNNAINHPFNILLFITQIALTSILLFLIFKWRNPSITAHNILVYIQLFLGLSLFIILKILLEMSVGVIFNISPLINRYVYQKLSYRNFMGILFMITILILLYVVPFSAFIFYTVVCIFAIFNGIALFSSYKEQRAIILPHLFYFILYLCALEISPYIILYKVLL